MTGQPGGGLDLESARNAAALLIALHEDDSRTADLICEAGDLRRMTTWTLVMFGALMQRAGLDPVAAARAMIAATLDGEAGQ